MKNILTFLSVFLCLSAVTAQGSIIGFSMSPTSPVATDTIYIYADLRFTSGDCELDNDVYHYITGNSIYAAAHHCLGPLTFICSAVDTFKINPLPAGTYDFQLNLTTGYSPPPCTPGVVADDDSTYTFTVGPSGPAGVNDDGLSEFKVFPNPVLNQINLPSVLDGTAYEIISISGQMIQFGKVQNKVINGLEKLPTGIYFLSLKTATGLVVKRMVKA